MPSPKSGSAGSIVAPAAPEKALDAAVADPLAEHKITYQQAQSNGGSRGGKRSGGGGGGSNGKKPYKPRNDDDGDGSNSSSQEEKPTAWVAVKVVDEQGGPMAGLAYELELPDGCLARGTLDETGSVRLEGIDPGSCKVCFPSLDPNAWSKK